jgi:hypothetical protein
MNVPAEIIPHLRGMMIPLYRIPKSTGQAAEIVMREILDDVPANRVIAAMQTYRNGLINEIIEEFQCVSMKSEAEAKTPTSLQ